MKKLLTGLVFLLYGAQELFCQTTGSTGNHIAEIFTDFHFNFNDTTRHTGFDITRAYLGYQYLTGGNISAKIILNAGYPEDIVNGSKQRRYAYFREASMTWANDKISVSIGLTGTRTFDFQQKFWGMRYIANTYQSLNGYGTVADIGIAVEYKINDLIKADMTLMNGEGYLKPQLDDNLKTSLGFTITPNEKVAIRLYSDIQRNEGLWQPVAIAFVGFKNDLITIGGEFSYKSNLDVVRGHHAWGFSSTGGLNITKKTEIFYRYDYSSSFRVAGDLLSWNYKNDGSFAVAGIQYSFTPNIKIALDYQGTYPASSLRMITDLIYINALFRF